MAHGEHPRGLLAGGVGLAGKPGPEPRRGDRHRGARGGAAGVVELGEVGGQGRVIEPEAVGPGVELAEGAGVGAAGVCAHRGVDQAARGRARVADGRSGRGDLGECILHDNGTYRSSFRLRFKLDLTHLIQRQSSPLTL